jgi:HlyD family secretion protein
MKRSTILIIPAIFLLAACSGNNNASRIYNGRVDTDIVRLSAQVNGIIDTLMVEEGEAVQKGQVLAVINSDRIRAQLRQQEAQLDELNVNLNTLNAQIRQVESQFKFTRDTFEKTKVMVSEGAATEQKRDELSTQVDVLQAQSDALRSNFQIIASKKAQLAAGMDLTRIALRDSRILSPLNGVVINKLLNENELAAAGRVVLELADLSVMEVIMYAPHEDLNRVKIGSEAKIRIDGMTETMTGKVKWISSESEFTPKTILTEETRTTLVYAVKLTVPNPNGILKIGMPVDVEI